jgi:hypothetical protein
MTILGISIGTRRNGIAVLRERKLEQAHVHTFNERWSTPKCVAILALYKKYLCDHDIAHVVVKIPKPSHFSLAIKQLIKGLNEYVSNHGCLIEYRTLEDIKRADPSITNRTTLRTKAVQHYPILAHELRKDSNNKHPYYNKLFEAVIAAHQRRGE